jgi:hypothetical protein
MARKSGKFIDKSATVDSSEQVGRLTVPGAEIVEIQQEGWGSIIATWVKNIIGFALLLALFVGVLITGLGATVMTFNTVGDDSHRSIVLRGAWADNGGNPPLGTKVAISEDTLAPTSNWWDWISVAWIGIPSASTVKIVSTDYDKLYVSGTKEDATVTSIANPEETGTLEDSITLNRDDYEDGEAVEFNYQLKKSYLVECVAGACEPGTYSVINEEQIYGEVR